MTTGFERARMLAWQLGRDHPGGSETIPLGLAARRTLASPAVARRCVPAADVSAMDGWAVCGPGPWSPDGRVAMGQPPGAPLAPGTAREITTGGAMPGCSTAVLRQEHVLVDGGRIGTADDRNSLAPFLDVRRAGEEVQTGEVVAGAGARVTPAVLAAAAVAGVAEVSVVRRPRVALAILGDEVATGGAPGPGCVGDAFGASIPAVLAGLGADVVSSGHVRDELAAVQEALDRPDVDLIVSTGGTGHGRGDHVATALDRIGSTIGAHGVAMRPGHPVILAARADGVPIIALPGNPFAAFVALVALGVPMITGLLGSTPPPMLARIAGAAMTGVPGGVRLIAVRETPDGVVPVERQGAAMAGGLVPADGIAVIGPAGVAAGSRCDLLALPW